MNMPIAKTIGAFLLCIPAGVVACALGDKDLNRPYGFFGLVSALVYVGALATYDNRYCYAFVLEEQREPPRPVGAVDLRRTMLLELSRFCGLE